MSSELPATITLDLPEGWRQIPLDRAGIVAMVDEAASAGESALPREQADFLKAFLTKRVVEAADASVVLAATYIEPLPENEVVPATSEEILLPDGSVNADAFPQVVLSAVGILSTHPASKIFSGETKVSVELLAQALATPPDKRTRYLHDPVIVDLPAGPAVEVKALESFSPGGSGERVSILHVSYHLPVGEGSGLALLSFQTPCLGLADEFLGLFRLMAGSLSPGE